MLGRLVTALTVLLAATPAVADKPAYLDLARRGWSYELRTTMIGRDLSIPVHINGRDLSGASLCVVGETPRPETLQVLDAFRELAHAVFGKPLTMRYAGPTARLCGNGRTVVVRLYSGRPPNNALSDDLGWMNDAYDFGLPRGRHYIATSPAMAQTFFGRRGQGTHIMVQQAAADPVDTIQESFFRSILIEELFQSFTFGMDVLLFDRSAAFTSKLEEIPLNLHRLPWGSPDFMRALLSSNPAGLCEFDVFMMHAVAQAPVDETNDPAFIDYIDADFDGLLAATRETVADPRYAPIIDRDCAPVRG